MLVSEAGIMMASQGEEVEVGDPRGREERGPGQVGGTGEGDVIGKGRDRISAALQIA